MSFGTDQAWTRESFHRGDCIELAAKEDEEPSIHGEKLGVSWIERKERIASSPFAWSAAPERRFVECRWQPARVDGLFHPFFNGETHFQVSEPPSLIAGNSHSECDMHSGEKRAWRASVGGFDDWPLDRRHLRRQCVPLSTPDERRAVAAGAKSAWLLCVPALSIDSAGGGGERGETSLPPSRTPSCAIPPATPYPRYVTVPS